MYYYKYLEHLGISRKIILDNIRMHLRELWWEGVDLMNLTHDRDQW